MKVRIKSGSQAGAIVEMDTVSAQNNIATGYAEAVPDELAPRLVPKPAPPVEPEPEPEPERETKSKKK